MFLHYLEELFLLHNESKTRFKKKLTIEEREDPIEALSLCKTIVSVTNIKGKKFDIFHKRKRLNLFFLAYGLDCRKTKTKDCIS